MQQLDLTALRELRQGLQHPMEVGKVVEHRWLKEIRLPDHKVVPAHVQEHFYVLIAEELQRNQRGLVNLGAGFAFKSLNLRHLRLPIEVPLLQTYWVQVVDQIAQQNAVPERQGQICKRKHFQ